MIYWPPSPIGLTRPWDKMSVLLLIMVVLSIDIHVSIAGGVPDPAANSSLPKQELSRISNSSGFEKSNLFANRFIGAAPGAAELGEFEIRRIKMIPSAKFGYQRMGLDLSVPIPFEFSIGPTDTYRSNSVEIKLQNMNLWIIEAGLELKINPTVRIFAHGAGSIMMLQRLASFVAETRGQFGTSEWSTHQLDWLTIGAGAAFEVLDPFSLVAGLKWDHFDLTLGGRSGSASINIGPYRNLNLTSVDVLSDLWMPYVGLGLFGTNYRISLTGTPVALTDVRVRTRLAATIVPSYMFWGEVFTYLDDPIKFIETNAEYSATIWGVRLSFWGKAAGLSGKGHADSGNTYTTNHPNLRVNIIEGGEATISRYNAAGGLALGLSF